MNDNNNSNNWEDAIGASWLISDE